MAVYVDDARILWKGKLRFHLTADSLAELHAFTASVGIKPCWFHRGRAPHYDITEPQRQASLAAGALAVDGRVLAEKARALRKRPKRGPGTATSEVPDG